MPPEIVQIITEQSSSPEGRAYLSEQSAISWLMQAAGATEDIWKHPDDHVQNSAVLMAYVLNRSQYAQEDWREDEHGVSDLLLLKSPLSVAEIATNITTLIREIPGLDDYLKQYWPRERALGSYRKYLPQPVDMDATESFLQYSAIFWASAFAETRPAKIVRGAPESVNAMRNSLSQRGIPQSDIIYRMV